MITTNTATSSDPQNYRALRQNAQSLLDIAKELEGIALAKSNFFDDADFQRLKSEFREKAIDALARCA